MSKSDKAKLIQKEMDELQKTTQAALTRIKRAAEVAAEAIVKVEQRALTGERLQQRIWQIWGHCRLNKNSLDSERHCRLIKEIIDAAVADTQSALESALRDIRLLKQQKKEFESECKRLSNELKNMQSRCEISEVTVEP